MEAKRGVFALLFVAIIVCSAMAMAMAAPGEDAGTSVKVVSSTPEVTSASIDPAEITLIPAISQFATLTAEVFCPNGVDWIDEVAIG